MSLNTIWFFLFVLIIAGYVILDGFDLGVGMLHIFVAKTDTERRLSLNSIGPIWDGNEVWLVLGGGALFAAFPVVYASLFSGFYAAMMLVLLFLILRTVAIEFRSKRPSSTWRNFWDFIFFLSSGGIALLLGVAFGNILRGVPIDANGIIRASLFDLLSPFALLVGVTTIFMLAMHGSMYLVMKTEGELQARVRRLTPPLMVIFYLLNTAIVIWVAVEHDAISAIFLEELWPAIFPALALGALIWALYNLRRGEEFWAFIGSGVMIALLLLSGAVGLYPNLLISSTDPAFNLTAYNAASQANTLQVMLIIALIGMPFVLLYTAGVYYIFRGKVELDPSSY